MASLPDSFDEVNDGGFDGLASDTFGSYSEFNQETVEDAQIYNELQENASFHQDEDVFAAPESDVQADAFSPEANCGLVNGVFVDSDSPILPPPSEMREEGIALREWRRQNAALLEEKEKIEKELLSQILQEASEFKVAFYEKRKVTYENYKTINREKEKLFLDSQEKLQKEADQNYWKAISELIPNEVPSLEKKGAKKDKEKKPSINVVQGPKPGKPTDLSRMRHILLKLKHETPAHLKLSLPTKAAKDGGSTKADNVPPPASPEAVVAA
ncbi:hypothetical protein V2J09_012090 [Rumex salicifolius]